MSKSFCPGCGEEVTNEQGTAIQCDPLEDDVENHWWHRRCLQEAHLLDGEKVTIQGALIDMLTENETKFSFLCHLCGAEKGEVLPPLPVQLVHQEIIQFDELESYGALTPEVKRLFGGDTTSGGTLSEAAGGLPVVPTSRTQELTGDEIFGLGHRPTSPSGLSGTSETSQHVFGVLEHRQQVPAEKPNQLGIESLDEEEEHLELPPRPLVPKQKSNVVGQSRFFGDSNAKKTGGELTEPPSTSRQNQQLQVPGAEGGIAPTFDPNNSMFQLVQLFTSQQATLMSELERQRSEDARNRYEQEVQRADRLEQQRREDETRRDERQAQQRKEDREFFVKLLGETRQPSGSSNSSSKTNPPTSNMSSGFAKPPKLEVPSFDGDIYQWPSFWDQFTQLIENSPKLSPVEKLGILLGKLQGAAKDAVKNYTLEAGNYPIVLEELKERYDDKDKIKRAYLDKLSNIAPVSNTSAAQLQKFSDEINSIARVLIPLVDDEQTLDMQCMTMMPLLFEKIPVLFRSQLLTAKGTTVCTHLSIFRSAIREQVKFQELVRGVSHGSSPDTPRTGSGGGGPRPPSKGSGAGLVGAGAGNKSGPQTPKPPQQPREKYCIFCEVSGQHRNFECPVYKTLEERRKKLGSRCFICLKDGHFTSACPTKGRYKCITCKSVYHNSCLCPKSFKKNPNTESAGVAGELQSSSLQSGDVSFEGVANLFEEDEAVAMQTVVTKVRNSATKMEFTAHIMYDTGCKKTYIDQKFATLLKLKALVKRYRNVSTFNCKKPRRMLAGITDIEVLGKDGVYVSLIGNIVNKITTSVHMDGFSLSEKDEKLVKGLQMADPQFNTSRPYDIDILIGDDYYPMLLEGGKHHLEKSGAYLLETKLGWVASGKIKEAARVGNVTDNVLTDLALFVDENGPVVLEEDSFSPMEDLWRFETLGIKDPKESTDDDHVALQQFKNTVRFEDGRVSVQWLKKPGIEKLPNNFNAALMRLKSLLKTLAKNEEYRKKYNQYFCDLLERLIIEKVFKEAKKHGFQIHYIPHQAVITPLHNTTKMRIVFDAGAATSLDRKSLNDYLYRGPNLLVDLGGLLLRFRLWLIAIISDIEKAFLQVALQESEKDLTRFLWLKDPTKLTLEDNVQVYRFCRVAFGFKPSPFLLAASVGTLLDKAPESQREIAEQIRENTYVDNVITGTNNVEEATEFYSVAKNLLAAGSMNLREWNSNSSELMDFIPEKDRDSRSSAKVLGLQWDTVQDTLSVKMKDLSEFQEAKTKRGILSCLASIFDPLGFFCCLKVQGIIFLQELWREKFDWDTVLPDTTLERWSELCNIFADITEIKIPRRISGITSQPSVQLHCFCDASQEAFSTVHYLRVQSESGETQVSLVFAKARVCPVSGLSVPRSELLGTLIGTRSLTYLKKQMGLELEHVYLWTDSQCVLGWLRNESKDQGPFVTNRVIEILSSENVTFKYVSTDDNPADLATKTRAKNFKMPWKFWFEGPEWLKLPVEMWPEFPENTPNDLVLLGGGSNRDLKGTRSLDLEKVLSVTDFSSFSTLVRVTSWVLRFIRKVKKRVEERKLSSVGRQTRSKTKDQSKNKVQLTKTFNEILSDVQCLGRDEMWEAQCLWLESVQRRAFPALFTRKIHINKLALSLKLKLGEDNLLRSEGRLGESDLTPSEKSPILLPSSSPLTSLIVDSFHRRFLHAGANQTLASIRSVFWIPRGRKIVCSVLNKCVHCKRFHAKPFVHPPMPNLPRERVSQVSPFTFTGIDFFGPLFYKSEQGEKKAWVLLLTCFTVRAIHLELVPDMSAENLLCALRRFVARRGRPGTIFSDNAKQFKLTDKILRQADKMSTVRQFLDAEAINWRFIPELSPWMGAAWERLVGVSKSSLKKSLGRSTLNFEQLRTILVEIEDVVNCRPITYVNMSKNDDDMIVLTPQKFLSTGRIERLPVIPEEDPDDLDYIQNVSTQSKIVQSWRVGQHYLNKFWDSWHKQYLLNLRERHASDKFPKVKSETFRCPKVGEIVMIKGVDVLRGLWKLGKVVELHVGRDSLVRSAKVKTASSREVITRPVSLLYPLEVQSFAEDQKEENPEPVLLGCAPDAELEEDHYLSSKDQQRHEAASTGVPDNLDSSGPSAMSVGSVPRVTVVHDRKKRPFGFCSRCFLCCGVFLLLLSCLQVAEASIFPWEISEKFQRHRPTKPLLTTTMQNDSIELHAEGDLEEGWSRDLPFHEYSSSSGQKRTKKKEKMGSFSLESGRKVGGKSKKRGRTDMGPPKAGRDPTIEIRGRTHYQCRSCTRPRPLHAPVCFCQMKNGSHKRHRRTGPTGGSSQPRGGGHHPRSHDRQRQRSRRPHSSPPPHQRRSANGNSSPRGYGAHRSGSQTSTHRGKGSNNKNVDSSRRRGQGGTPSSAGGRGEVIGKKGEVTGGIGDLDRIEVSGGKITFKMK